MLGETAGILRIPETEGASQRDKLVALAKLSGKRTLHPGTSGKSSNEDAEGAKPGLDREQSLRLEDRGTQ